MWSCWQKIIATLSILVTQCLSSPPSPLTKGLTEIYIVPHSHCDPGWWYTFDDYHKRWVVGILDAVINTLVLHKERTFIWAEVSYFKKWYLEKDDSVKESVKKVLQEGRLEFVTGGWVMHDEAVSHYRDDLLQLQLGQAWLWTEFKVKPVSAWLIDPFGHSPTTPLFYKGMKGAVLNRIHYKVREDRKAKKDLEFWWKPKWMEEPAKSSPRDAVAIKTAFEDNKGLFVHTLTKGYYDIPNTCGPDRDVCETFDFENLQHGIRITKSNLEERAATLAAQYLKKATHFKTKHVLMPLGDDFKYKTISFTEDFLGMWDQLFDFINANPSKFGLRIRYSNLSSYFDAVQSEKESTWSVYDGNFLQYSDRDDEYWSGFYTSRAILKRWIRESQISLRFAELLSVWMVKQGASKSKETVGWNDLVLECQENQSLLQHHDAVTGTARRAVVSDYQNRLSSCVQRINDLGKTILEKVLKLPSNSVSFIESAPTRFVNLIDDKSGFQLLPDRSFSKVSISNGRLLIFNTLSFARKEYIQVKVTTNQVKLVNGITAEKVPFQLTQSISYIDGSIERNNYILSFYADLKEPLGYVEYLLISSDSEVSVVTPVVYRNFDVDKETSKLSYLSNEVITLNFGEKTLLLSHLELATKCKSNMGKCKSRRVDLVQTFAAYDSSRSGAYIFNPGDSDAIQFIPELEFVIKVDGHLASEIMFKYKSGYGIEGQVFRLYHDTQHSHYFDHNILMDISRKYGNHDVVVRYDGGKSFGQEDVSWTDANGWIPIQNPIETSKLRASQFRPMTSKFMVSGKSHKFEWLTRSSLAVANYQSGVWEFVLDRQVARDDGRGLGEMLDDNRPFSKEFRMIPTFFVDKNDVTDMVVKSSNGEIMLDGFSKPFQLNRFSETFLFPPSMVVTELWEESAAVKVESSGSLNPLGDAALPYGISIHSIRRCLSQPSDICILLEHDRSVDFPVTVHLYDDTPWTVLSDIRDPMQYGCKLYSSFFSTDWNDPTVKECGKSEFTMFPYEIRALRISSSFFVETRKTIAGKTLSESYSKSEINDKPVESLKYKTVSNGISKSVFGTLAFLLMAVGFLWLLVKALRIYRSSRIRAKIM